MSENLARILKHGWLQKLELFKGGNPVFCFESVISRQRPGRSPILPDYPELNDYIAADANISHSPLFESAVVKILDGKKETLTDAERALVVRFVVRPVTAGESTAAVGAKRSYASRLRERKRQRLEQREKYVDLRFISGTSASAERLFSSAKHVLRSTRKRLTPVNFEKLLFLKHNRFLWNADLVSQAMKGVSAADVAAAM
ncbi:hypothetical protein BBJ28_00027081 [Nothophytophthora sp. Chile5]|nr:hypothetical protein BBJ28_00027081 [Nothophytophthora sp. Chile5]